MRGVAPRIAIIVVGVAVGCDRGSPRVSDGKKGPPPTMGWHYPANGATAPSNGSIRVQFDRFLAPDTASRQGICVSTGNDACLGSGATAGAFAVEYDPVDRVVVLKPQHALAAGSYTVRILAPKSDADTTGIRAFDGVGLATVDSFEFKVDTSMAVEGCPAAARPDMCEPKRSVDFCTAVDKGCNLGTSCTVPTDVGDSVGSYVEVRCATSNCHGFPTGSLKAANVGEALVLNDGPDAGGIPGAIVRIAKQRVVATETATDPDPGVSRAIGQDTFGRNMPYIDPKNPGNSYVLYKMIIGMLRCPERENDAILPGSMVCAADGGYSGRSIVPAQSAFYKCSDIATALAEAGVDPDAGPCPKIDPTTLPAPQHPEGEFIPYLVEPWVPDREWKPPISGEYERLRYHVRGNPMPFNLPPEGPQNMHLISAWIAAGAPTANCQ